MSEARPFWRRRLLPLALVLAGVNGVVLAAWTVPRWLRLRSAAARAETARAEAVKERETVAALRERADAIRSNGADLARFYRDQAGAGEADLLPLLEEIEKLARGPGLKPGRRSYERQEEKDLPLERVAVTLPLDGSYPQLVGFLREVESSSRFLIVDQVALRGGEAGSGSLQVGLSAYLRQAPGGAGRGRAR